MRTRALLFLASLIFAGTATAAPPTKAEYSADWTMETASGAHTGKIYSAAGKERRDMNMGGDNMSMIIRNDKKVMWNLMPSERMYMQMALSDKQRSADDMNRYEVEQTTVGEEVINGVKTTKSKIILKERGGSGSKMGGFWWTTKDGIVMKIDVIAVEKGSKDRLKMELSNLKVGRQDPGLFEVPAGYSQMSMPDMGQMMGGGREPAKQPVEKGAGKEGGGYGLTDGLKDAFKLLK